MSFKVINEEIGKYRWTICSLVFFASTINYLDRNIISLLKDDYLMPQFGWNETDYAHVTMAFTIAYAIGLLLAGRFIDKVGTKIGYALSLALWSLSAIGHSFARSTLGFMVARGSLGLSESGNFPAAVKTMAEWFPKKERALATSVFNSGTGMGAILTILTVPFIAVAFGWKMAFISVGAVGFIWLFFWFVLYEIPAKHKKLKASELAYINSDKDEQEQPEEIGKRISWFKLLQYRQTWAFVLGKFMTDGVWWFYLFWLPSFLNNEYSMVKTAVVWPLITVYIITSIGSIYGGWISGYLIGRGWQVYKARFISMMCFVIAILPLILAQELGHINYWYAILIIGLAASAHQAWSANLFTTVSDMFPKKEIASVVGLGGMAGAVGGILLQWAIGLILDHFKDLGNIKEGYYILFIICTLAYIIALLGMKILAPKMKRVEF